MIAAEVTGSCLVGRKPAWSSSTFARLHFYLERDARLSQHQHICHRPAPCSQGDETQCIESRDQMAHDQVVNLVSGTGHPSRITVYATMRSRVLGHGQALSLEDT